MVQINVQKVRGKMAEKGFTMTALAKELRISRNTLACYFETPAKIPYTVVASLAELLCDTTAEASSIFFAPNLRETKVLCEEGE